MYETKIAEYWAQAQLCSAKADSANPPSKQLWMQMAQDWVSLADSLASQSDRPTTTAEGNDWNHSWPSELFSHRQLG